MGRLIMLNSLSLLCVASVFLNRLVISDNLTPRGVPLSRASLYDPQKDFSCLDGSKLIPFSMVNDDYCDCADGSDEPGTSACSRGSFYCKNAGHMSVYIQSSRVNDGICDCCDGTDEIKVQCPNTCDELGRAAREEAERHAELSREGYQKRLEMVNTGKQFRKDKNEEKARLEADRQRLDAIKQELEKLKDTVEVPEKEALERHRLIQEEKEKQRQQEQPSDKPEGDLDAESMFNLLDSNEDGKLTMDEIKARQTFDKNKDGVVSDDEALFFLNMDEEMSKEEFLKSGWLMAKPFFLLEQGMFKPPEGLDDKKDDGSQVSGGQPVTEEPPLKELSDEEIQAQNEQQAVTPIPGVEDDEEELYEPEDEVSSEDHKAEEPIEDKYDEETQRLVDAADKARAEYNEASGNVREIERQLDELNEIISLDFADDERFAPLHGQCYDFEDREYVYTLCPFKSATQKSRSGGSEVNLGKWGKWAGPDDNKYLAMMYDHGQSCWNGPTRSAKVNLSCGVDNRLIGVSEPSRCEYQYEFTSPAACSKPVSQGHDEL